MDAVNRRIESVRGLAEKAFAGHLLAVRYSQGVYRSWLCWDGRSSRYCFYVWLDATHVIVTGDLGVLVLRVPEIGSDLLGWLRRAVADPWYLAGKAAAEIETDEWDADVAREWAEEHAALGEDGHLARASADALEDLRDAVQSEDRHAFGEAYFAATNSYDVPQCLNLKCGFLWQREALRLFLRLLDQGEKGET